MSHEQNDSPSNTQTKHKHITLGLVCAWILGVSFAISVIPFLAEGDLITSFISLLMAAMLLPPVWKRIRDRTNINLSSGVKVVLVIAGLVLIGFVTPSSPASDETTASQAALERYSDLIYKNADTVIEKIPSYSASKARACAFRNGYLVEDPYSAEWYVTESSIYNVNGLAKSLTPNIPYAPSDVSYQSCY